MTILVIRFTNTRAAAQEQSDLELPVNLGASEDTNNITVRWLKNSIRKERPICSRKRLRLICSGRVINEKTDFKREIYEPLKRHNPHRGNDENDKIFIHCLVGEDMTPEQLAKEDSVDEQQTRTTGPEVAGFDRLLQQGFSSEDVNDLRRQFHQVWNWSQNTGSNTSDYINDLEEEERVQNSLRELEDRWIDSSVNASDIAAGGPTPGAPDIPMQQQGDVDEGNFNEDLLLGLLIGVFLGIVSLIFIISDDTIFNKRQKFSIVGGVLINFCFALMRVEWI